MKGTISLSPDELAQLVEAVCAANGIQATTLALYKNNELVGYDRAEVGVEFGGGLEVYNKPKMSSGQLRDMLYPVKDNGKTFKSRSAAD